MFQGSWGAWSVKSSIDPNTFYLVPSPCKSLSLSIWSKLAHHHPPCVPTCRKVGREVGKQRKQTLWWGLWHRSTPEGEINTYVGWGCRGGHLIGQRERLGYGIVSRSRLTLQGTLTQRWPLELGWEVGPLCPLTSYWLQAAAGRGHGIGWDSSFQLRQFPKTADSQYPPGWLDGSTEQQPRQDVSWSCRNPFNFHLLI